MGSLNVYAAATRNPEEGLAIVSSCINALHCKSSWSDETCKKGLTDFRSVVSYVRLKGTDDYQMLQKTLKETNESLRIYYLSVSPSLYEGLASTINQYARSAGEMRVVFEKPFGKVSNASPTSFCERTN
jgi:glucose-6-phosphate 1-dehydrogenase